jgi:hypothetical protein
MEKVCVGASNKLFLADRQSIRNKRFALEDARYTQNPAASISAFKAAKYLQHPLGSSYFTAPLQTARR